MSDGRASSTIPGSELLGPGIYGLLSPDGVKIGEHGTGPEVHPDTRDFEPEPAATTRLVEYAAQWLPGVDPATAAPLTCLYTTTPDSNFVVDRVDRVTVAAGFSGHGFKFAPAIGELLAGPGRGKHFCPRVVFPVEGPGQCRPSSICLTAANPPARNLRPSIRSDMSTIVTIAGSPSSVSSSDALLSQSPGGSCGRGIP